MKIYRDKDADIALVRDKSIVVVGYGNQGTAFAQNLRDSGLNVSVSLKERSSTIRRATEDGFPVISNGDAHLADMIIMMIPDHLHGEFFDTHLKNKLRRGRTLVFAHGYSIHFGLIMVLNLLIGANTPPFGVCLFIVMDIAKVPFGSVVKAILPFLIPLLLVLFLITFIPDLVLFIPNLLLK